MTQPDRPAGRGFALAPSPVKKLAAARGIQVTQPMSLRDAPARAELKHFRADVIVVAAYGLILPQPVLELPRYGAINIHASLLPRWRGATPSRQQGRVNIDCPVDRKSTRLNSRHSQITYAVFCLQKQLPIRLQLSRLS